MDCARFLVAESMNQKIPLPVVYVHSANPIGAANMMGYINNYKHITRQPQDCVRWIVPHTV